MTDTSTVDADLLDRVRALRATGLSPKQIAGTLGERSGTITPLVRAVAAQDAGADREPAVVGCWVSPGWSGGLTVHGHAEWPDDVVVDEDGSGVACVAVARRSRPHRVSVCGYLVDTHCLGVKSAIGPDVMSDGDLPGFLRMFFPSPDFAPAAGHLGPWAEDSAITFGRDGVPFYVQGPYDDARAVLRTLTSTVGEGNFHFITSMDLATQA